MRKLYLISLPILIVFNILNIKNGDIRLYGIFVIIAAFGIIGLISNRLKPVLGLIALIVLTDLIFRILIDQIGGYIVKSDAGIIVPFYIQLIAQMVILVLSLGLIGLIGGLKQLLLNNKRKKSIGKKV
jgi:hypothetical protein